MHTFQYTVRGIPAEVDQVLRERAKRRKVSINQLLVEELTNAAIGQRQIVDFQDVVGRWTPDDAFDETLARQREINVDDWR